MSQYIKRKEILNREVCKGIECQDCPFAEGPECRLRKYILHTAPSANVTEPKRGEWIFKTVFPNDKSEFPMGYLECSVCGSHHSNSTPCNYCDNCGADMRGNEE